MMHEGEKSDSAIVAEKPTNKAGQPAAEPVEPRAGTKGKANQQSTRRAQDRESVSQALGRIRQAAKERKKEKFTSLLHHIDPPMLRTAFYALARNAAPGVDGMTWETYEKDLDRRIEELHGKVQGGAYRALPSRRRFIPKSDGSQRPLAVAALEDKIVQRAVTMVLNAIYEEDFLGFSYGFRRKRSQHAALDALTVGIDTRKVSWILDADIRSFFNEVSQEWLVRFVEHRIGDKRIVRLIQKWLKAGVLDEGIVVVEETYGPPRLQDVSFIWSEQSAQTYPAFRQRHWPRWRFARPDPHKGVGVERHFPPRVSRRRSIVRPSFSHHPQTSRIDARRRRSIQVATVMAVASNVFS